MCNCSTNSCDCNEYRVSTGPQGNTGPQGPQGPAGPPGNRTYLISNNYVSSEPETTGTGSYEKLEEYTLSGSTLSNNGDSIIIRTVYKVSNGLVSVPRTFSIKFGNVTYTKNLPVNGVNILQGLQVVTLKVSRVAASSQLLIAEVKYENGTGFNSRITATETLSNSIIIEAGATVSGISAIDQVKIVEFSIEKIKNDN
jgi:hypothetical protein